LLHNQNVFDEFRRIQQNKKQEAEKLEQQEKARLEAEKQKKLEEERLASKMEALSVHDAYKPPQTYMDKYKDPDFFNYQYDQYVKHIQS